MKKSFLTFLDSIIPYTITPAKYILYLALGFAAWHVTGLGLYNIFTSNIVSLITANFLYGFEFFVNLIPIFPIRFFNIPAYIASSFLSLTKLITLVPAPVASTFLSPIIVVGEFMLSSKLNLSELAYDKLKSFENNNIFGHAIRNLKKYSEADSIETYLSKKIKYYKTASISPIIIPSIVSIAAFTGAYFFGLPLILGGVLSSASYSALRDNPILKDIGKYIAENISKLENLKTITTYSVNIANAIAPFFAFYRGNFFESIVKNVPFKTIFSSGVKGSAGLTYKFGLAFSSIAGLTIIGNLVNIGWTLIGKDNERNSLHRVAKSSFEIFSISSFLTVSLACLAYMVTPAPILAPVIYGAFATSGYTMIESAVLGAGSTIAMIWADKDGLPKLYQDAKNFLFKDKFWMFFDKPFGKAIAQSWCSLGGVVIGSFIGSKLPMPEWIIEKFLPNGLNPYISNHPSKDSNFIQPMGKALSSWIGAMIGGAFARWVASDIELEQALPPAPVAKPKTNSNSNKWQNSVRLNAENMSRLR